MKNRMRSWMRNRKKRARGTTLVELAVYVSIFGMVLTSIYGVFVAGVQYFHASSAYVDVQGAEMASFTRLVREVGESTIGSVAFYPNAANAGVPRGIVFASPRDGNNQFQLGLTSGKPLWAKYVCYYLEASQTDPGEFVIVRKEQMIPGGPLAAVSPSASTTQTFQQSALPARIMARQVAAAGFDTFSGSIAAPDYNIPTSPIFVRVSFQRSHHGRTNIVSDYTQLTLRN